MKTNNNKISYIHVFPATPEAKKDRSQQLAALNSRKKALYIDDQVGKTPEALIEENNMDGTCSGTTGNHLKVIVPINNKPRGALVSVRIQGIQEDKLVGIPIFRHN